MCKWFCSDAGLLRDSFWSSSTSWERDHSNEYELWLAESDRSFELMEQAHAIKSIDPDTSFRIFLEAAETGSVRAMEMVAWHYHTGTTVSADFQKAQEYYHRALYGGSRMATINYARLLMKYEYFDRAEQVLEESIRSGFVPASFWLGWLRHQRSSTRKTYREIRPLLEHAAENGHPGARLILARLMLRGKFGIGEISKGFSLILQAASQLLAETKPVDPLAAEATPSHFAVRS